MLPRGRAFSQLNAVTRTVYRSKELPTISLFRFQRSVFSLTILANRGRVPDRHAPDLRTLRFDWRFAARAAERVSIADLYAELNTAAAAVENLRIQECAGGNAGQAGVTLI